MLGRNKSIHGVAKPLRIGIWCRYSETLTPRYGIGVFVFNLIDGMLESGADCTLVLLIMPGDHQALTDLVARGRGRIEVIPRPSAGKTFARRLFETWSIARGAAMARLDRLHASVAKGKAAAFDLLRNLLRRREQRPSLRKVLLLVTAFVGIVAFLPAWALYAAIRLVVAAAKGLSVPLRLADRMVKRLERSNWLHGCPSAEELIDEAACDIWLVPHSVMAQPVTFPAVVVIHDMVHRHCDGLPSVLIEAADRYIPARASEAVLCACMANFIRDSDLYGQLHLPPSKVRVVKYAPPTDFPELTDAEADELLPKEIIRPFLFYPGSLFSHKNHRILIETLAELRRRGEDWLDVVFTSMIVLPPNLRGLIEQHGLVGRVHQVGCVDRRTLAALFMRAFATTVTALYEQGSFPIYEAIHWRCPVACSDIAPYREQCEAMGNAMIYFDPRDAASVADAVLAIRDDRRAIIERQWEAARPIWQRSWRHVAVEWLRVFEEAASLSREKRRAA